MSLINLQTDLTNLRWGRDTPGGGDSGLPYIKTSLPQNSSTLEYIALESAKFSQDFPKRGGLYSIRAAAEDAIRIRKFLTDFPKGANYTLKQIGLQKSNPFIETGKNGGRINTRTYNLNTNMLLSVLTAGDGIYYPRSGATPLTLLNDNNKYANIVSRKEKTNNRLVNLSNKNKNKIDTFKFNELGISVDPNLLFEYQGGPGSLYGIGNTIIRKPTDNQGYIYDINNPKNNFIYNISPVSSSILYNTSNTPSSILSKWGFSYDNENILFPTSSYNENIFQSIVNRDSYIITKRFDDFRKQTNNFSRDYTSIQVPMITRVNIGSPGGRTQEERKDINIVYKLGQDKINLSKIFYNNFDNPVERDSKNIRDLIKFSIEVIDNDNPNMTYRVHLRALLDSITDNISSNIESKKYMGRGEDFYNYTGFKRDISFSFTVMAQSKQEMKPIWQKLNYLTSTLYPDYSIENNFLRGNIHRITIGDYLYRMPGFLKSLNFTIDKDYSWEIKMDEPESGSDQDMMELPQLIKVSCTFVPIFDELPRTITRNNSNISALISKNRGNTENFIRNQNIFENI